MYCFRLKEPKLEQKKRPNRFNEEPRSLFDEQIKLTTALSASACSSGRLTFLTDVFCFRGISL